MDEFQRSRRYGNPSGFSPAFPQQFFRQNPSGPDIPSGPTVVHQGVPAPMLPGPSTPGSYPLDFSAELIALLENVYRQWEPLRYGNFVCVPLTLTNVDSIILPSSDGIRTFLLFVNTDAAATAIVNFGSTASAVPIIGLPIGPNNGSFLLDAVVAQNDIHAVSSAASSSAVLVYCNKSIPT